MTNDRSRPVPEPAPIYWDLRRRIFNFEPGEMGFAPSADFPRAWGALMDLGFSDAVVTLLSLADGTTSLYFGTGGGMVGSGEHLPVVEASRAFVTEAENNLDWLEQTDEYPLPEVGRVRFYVLTYEGVFTGEAGEDELAEQYDQLSALYFSGQGVITALRETTQRNS